MWWYLVLLVAVARVGFTGAEYIILKEGTPALPWSVYLSADYNDCSHSGKRRRFPDVYELDNYSTTRIGPPRNFSVTFFEEEAIDMGGRPNDYYPGMKIQFFPPELGSEYVKGYEVTIAHNDGRYCVIFRFTNVTWPVESMIEQTLFPVNGLTHYRVSMATLPKHDVGQITDMLSVVTGPWGVRKNQGPLPPPAFWFAAIGYDVLPDRYGRSLEIVFSRPPPQYGFQKFKVALLSVEDHLAIQEIETPEFVCVFSGVLPGRYTVRIRPVDDFFSTDACLCRLYSGVCFNCLSTETEVFTVE